MLEEEEELARVAGRTCANNMPSHVTAVIPMSSPLGAGVVLSLPGRRAAIRVAPFSLPPEAVGGAEAEGAAVFPLAGSGRPEEGGDSRP